MRTIATFLADRSEKAFAQKQSLKGTPLGAVICDNLGSPQESRQALSQDTATRHLINSITADWDKTEAVAGTNVVYAATHQFGAKQGEFGRFSIIKTQ